ncbi:MAG: DUF4234 domain-containing protein [Schwartzia sp. (in: firmicutes)]
MDALRPRDVMLRILLTFFTCGLYGLYWMKTLTDDIHRFSGRPTTPGGGKVVLLTLVTCSLYFYYWLYQISGELVEARRERGLSPDAISNATYTVTVVVTSLLAVIFSTLQSMGDIPESVYQDLSNGEAVVAGLVALLVIGVFWVVVQTVIAAGILWLVYRRKDPSPRILYMLLAVFRLQILTAAFLQASLNDGIAAHAAPVGSMARVAPPPAHGVLPPPDRGA